MLFSGGLCAADFDGDDDADIVVPGFAGQFIQFFRNDGDMLFSELSSSVTGLGVSQGGRATQAVDIDSDGDLDLYIGGWHAPVELYINDGLGHFVESASAWGLTHITSNWSVSFGDYDRDGFIDIHVGNRELSSTGGPPGGIVEDNMLLRNTGNGSFEDVSAASGILAASARATFVSAFFDYDEDGWPDILVGQDKGFSFGGNQLFRNQGDGTFVDIADQVEMADEIDAMGVDFVDAFNDGGFDVFFSDVPSDHLFRSWSPSLGIFEDRTVELGVTGGQVGWSSHFADLDNDGWQDLYVVQSTGNNLVFRNTTGDSSATTWEEIEDPVPIPGQNTAVLADFDGDGSIDMLHRVRGPAATTGGLLLFRNRSPERPWVRVECVGRHGNRDGFGAKVEIITSDPTSGPMVQRQYKRSGQGFQTGVPRYLHFGLGDSQSAWARVTWPSGQVQDLGPVSSGQTVEAHEATFEASNALRVGGSTELTLECPDDYGTHYCIVLAADAEPLTALGDGRFLPIRFDAISVASLTPGNGLIVDNIAPLVADVGVSTLTLPLIPALAGQSLFATGFTYRPGELITNVLGQPLELRIAP